MERLRSDKEKTEKMLKEREALLDAKMKEMEEKSEIQKNLEIQVDRLFRLKELKYRCMVRTIKLTFQVFTIQFRFVSNFDFYFFDCNREFLRFERLEKRNTKRLSTKQHHRHQRYDMYYFLKFSQILKQFRNN